MDPEITSSILDEIIYEFQHGMETTTRIEDSPYYSPFALPPTYYLGVYISLLILQAFSITGNGFIILLFVGTTRLRKNTSLRLLFTLCITDFVFAVSTLPYTINYVVGWSPVLLDYDPMYIITSAIPLVVQFKVNLIITIMIAIDRLQAMKRPAHYRTKNQMRFVWLTLGIGLGLSAIDLVLEYETTEFNVRRYNSGAIGTFQSEGFKAYWGISNMILNIIALLLTLWVAVELNRIRGKSSNPNQTKRDFKQMSQANRLSFGILMISFVFLMIPSTFVGVVEFAGIHLFQILGPFYILGLLFAGVSNSFVYVSLHVELRQAAIQLIKKRRFMNDGVSSTNIAVTTTAGEGFVGVH